MSDKIDKQLSKIIAAARRRVAAMDRTDGSSVADDQLDSALRTIILALESGMSCQLQRNHPVDTAIADAFIMAQQLEFRYRPADQKARGLFPGAGE